MRVPLIVNIGITALIVTSCVTPPPIRQSANGLPSITAATGEAVAPKALDALSCVGGQRIVIVVSPVESPLVAGRILKRSGSIDPFFFPTINPFNPSIPWFQMAIVNNIKVDDLTTEFTNSIGKVLDSVDLQLLLLTRAEGVIKPRTSCETVFYTTTWEKPAAAFRPTDRVVTILFYSTFTGSPPVLMGLLSTTVMTGENAAEFAKRADELGKIMEKMKKLEPYIRVYDKPPDFNKVKQYAALAEKLRAGLMPYIDGTGTLHYTSPDHSTDEWLANGGAVTIQEIAAVIDQLIGDVAGILFR